jgi:hypothetical protein
VAAGVKKAVSNQLSAEWGGGYHRAGDRDRGHSQTGAKAAGQIRGDVAMGSVYDIFMGVSVVFAILSLAFVAWMISH